MEVVRNNYVDEHEQTQVMKKLFLQRLNEVEFSNNPTKNPRGASKVLLQLVKEDLFATSFYTNV